MRQALNDAAWSPGMSPEGLWRASCSWTAQGYDEQGEWLHEMATTMIDISELPESSTEGPMDLRVKLLREDMELRRAFNEAADGPF